MKRYAMLVLAAALMAGCGSREEKTTLQGVEEKGNQYISQGMKYLGQSDIPRAIQSFDQAIKQEPNNPSHYIVLGQVYMRLKNYARAVDSLLGAVRVDPMNGEAYYLLAVSQELLGNKDKAVEAAQKSVEIFMSKK